MSKSISSLVAAETAKSKAMAAKVAATQKANKPSGMGENGGAFDPLVLNATKPNPTPASIAQGVSDFANQNNTDFASVNSGSELASNAENTAVTGDAGGAGGSGLIPKGTPTDLSGGTADDIFVNGLANLGLSDLASGVQGLVNQGINGTGIAAWIRSQPSYAARFPGMSALNSKGMGISEAQYLSKEDADRQLLYQYLGPTAKNYDNYAQLGSFITGFTSTAELQGRLQAIHDEVNASPATKAWIKNAYGLSDNDVAAAWLDPNLTSDQVALRDAAGAIGGAGTMSGFGTLTQAQAEQLATNGVTQSQALSGFGKIGMDGQLTQQLPGETNPPVTQNDLINATFSNNAQAQQKINLLTQQRVGQFQQNGGPAMDATGVSGLRSAAVQ